jgi:hypothetical protein
VKEIPDERPGVILIVATLWMLAAALWIYTH